MIDVERRLLFIHIPRTGGSSVEAALVGKDWWLIEPQTKHISASRARRLYGEDTWRAFTKFSIVRNPWDRLVSMWSTGWWWGEKTHLRGVKPASFKDFILTLRLHPNEHYDSFAYRAILDEEMDAVLRFEFLQADFSAMLKKRNLPNIRLPRISTTDRKQYRTYFDNETADLVARMHAQDIRKYGYAF